MSSTGAETEPDLTPPAAGDPASSWEALVGGVRVHFGIGAVARLPERLQALGIRRPLLVTDPGIRAAGIVDPALEACRRADLRPALFDGVEENPTTEHVEAGLARAREAGADGLVGFGGGSAMDTAKGINFLLTNGGRMEEYRGRNRATEPMLPSVGVPTTAGTGSEAQSFALIATAETHEKMACGDDKARFAEVFLDPELTATLPRDVAVATGFDAIAHTVESWVSTAHNPVSRMYGRAAWGLLAQHFPASLEGNPEDGVRGAMLLGSHLAGAAIEASMLGAAHACANPLTARHGIVHGIAVGLMLPHVVRHNTPAAGADYALLAADVAVFPELDLPRLLEQLWSVTGVPEHLGDHGVDRDELPELAREAAGQWTANFNPRSVGEDDLLQIYEAAY